MEKEIYLFKDRTEKEGTIRELLDKDNSELQKMAEHSNNIQYKNKVYPRALIEIGNVCQKNCEYCGIRKDNENAERYLMSNADIIERVNFAKKKNIKSIVLQSGEITHTEYIRKINLLLEEIENLDVSVTLSMGEQRRSTLKRWRELGAERYLLRMETFNKEIYENAHPKDHLFVTRKKCLENLTQLDYQIGTGILVGLPGMDKEDLVFEIYSMLDQKIDMVGLGPIVTHENAPLFKKKNFERTELFKNYLDTLKIISILRILRPEINIAATTALDTFEPDGRIKAIKHGANVIMPNITPLKYRQKYLLYDNKPCIDNDTHECISCIDSRLKKEGYSIAFGETGIPRNYKNRKSKLNRDEMKREVPNE